MSKEAQKTILVTGGTGSLGHAFLANFQLFTEDNWANIMFEYMECFGTSASLYGGGIQTDK